MFAIRVELPPMAAGSMDVAEKGEKGKEQREARDLDSSLMCMSKTSRR